MISSQNNIREYRTTGHEPDSNLQVSYSEHTLEPGLAFADQFEIKLTSSLSRPISTKKTIIKCIFLCPNSKGFSFSRVDYRTYDYKIFCKFFTEKLENQKLSTTWVLIKTTRNKAFGLSSKLEMSVLRIIIL